MVKRIVKLEQCFERGGIISFRKGKVCEELEILFLKILDISED